MGSGFKNFFSNEFDTMLTDDFYLKTHIYGNEYTKVKEEVISIIKAKGFKLTSVDDKFREILLESRKCDIICTINQISYYENKVDFKIVTRYLFPCGRAKKLVVALYEELNHRLILKQ